MGKRILPSRMIFLFLVVTIMFLSLGNTQELAKLEIDQMRNSNLISPQVEDPELVVSISEDGIDGGRIAYEANVSFYDEVSVWYSETTDYTPRGSLFKIGIATVNEFLVPGEQFTSIVYLKPLSFADLDTVDFHDIILYYRVFDDNGQTLYNGTFEEMYNDWFELYLNSGEDHLGFGSFTFTVPTWASAGQSYHEVKAVFREDVIGEPDPVNEMGWYRLINADITTTGGKNTGTKSTLSFFMEYEITWSLSIEQVGSISYYVEMNGYDYSIKVTSYYSKFLNYNLTFLGNDKINTITFNETGGMISYEDPWSLDSSLRPYYSYDLDGTVFTGTIDISKNKWINVGRKNSVDSFFIGIFPTYFGWGWGDYGTLPNNGNDAFMTDDLLVVLCNASDYSVGDTLSGMSVNSRQLSTYQGVELETITFGYSAEDGSQLVEKSISTEYGFLMESKAEAKTSYQTSEKWQAEINYKSSVIVTSLKFIDSTEPRVTSDTEFSFYEGILPQITLEIDERFPGEYSLYRDGILVDSGSWNSTKLTLFLEMLPKGLYEYRLYLEDKMGNLGYATIKLRVLEPTVPSPPENLIVSIQGQGVLVSWKPPKDDGGSQLINYVVYRRMVNETSYSFLANATTTQYLDKDVVIGQIYYYVVTAANKVGESRPSNEGQIIIPTTIVLSTETDSGSSGFLNVSIYNVYVPLAFLVAALVVVRKRK